jgi:hypothetical protein
VRHGQAAPTGVPAVPAVLEVEVVEGSRAAAVPAGAAAVVVVAPAPAVAARPARVAVALLPAVARPVPGAVPAAVGEASPAVAVPAVVGEAFPAVVAPVVVRAAASPAVAVPARSSGRGARRSAVAARS